MPFWWAIPAAVELGKTLLSKKQSTPNPLSGEYGQYLNRVKKEGKYSPVMQSGIMGKIGAEAGNVAQGQVASIRGNLESRGMGNSVAGVRALASPGLKQQEILADKAADLTTANEESKAAADEKLAGLMGNWRNQRAAEDTANQNRIVSGLGNALSAGVSGYQDEQLFGQAQDFNKGVTELEMLIKSGQWDSDRARELRTQLFGGAGKNPLAKKSAATGDYPYVDPNTYATAGPKQSWQTDGGWYTNPLGY